MATPKKHKNHLQRIALAAYAAAANDLVILGGPNLDDNNVEDALNGDTLALFVWHEVGEAQNNPERAAELMQTAIMELQNVEARLLHLVNIKKGMKTAHQHRKNCAATP